VATTPSHRAWSRRRFLGTAAAASGVSLVPAMARAQAGPWAQRPPGAPGSATFVVWQYGKIYEQIARQFEDDWGVKVNQIIEPNVEPQVAKLTTMFAAGDTVDVSQSPMQYLASYIDQGIAQPIDGLPGTWFSLTCNRGGVVFDKQLAPQLGPGSVAREALKWWQSTFKEELADPNSLNLRFIPAVKAFNAGQHVYLGTLHHYYVSLINDAAQSPIAGKGRVLGHPGDGRTIGYTMLYILTATPKGRVIARKPRALPEYGEAPADAAGDQGLRLRPA
jgi:hypothetical protein